MSSATRRVEHTLFASPESAQRESLQRELHESLIAISYREPRPKKELLLRAARLGQLVIGFANPLPPAINLVADDDGDELLFTLYGVANRSVDCWIASDNGTFHYVAAVGSDVGDEATLEIEAIRRVLEWLAGRTSSI